MGQVIPSFKDHDSIQENYLWHCTVFQNQHNSKYSLIPIFNYTSVPFADYNFSIHWLLITEQQSGYWHSSIYIAFFDK